MTMSVPATLPAVAATGKAGSSSPANGVTSAPGQAKKGAPGAAEAAGVADMFAALVATLTAQMQPATATPTLDGAAAAKGGAAGGAVAGLFDMSTETGVVGFGCTGPSPDLAAAAAVGKAAAVAGPVAGEFAVAGAPGTTTEIVDLAVDPAGLSVEGTVDATSLSADAEGDAGGAAADHRATPAVPATPADGAERAQRATPAVPATAAQPPVAGQAAALAAAAGPVAAPAAESPDTESNVAALPATPATPATPSTTRAGEVAAAQRPAPADPHVQVARVVRPLRLGDDGTYELALDLTPAELGRVRIEVEMRGATISLSLRSDNPATRQLLQTSLEQLRSELEAAGLHAGHLDVNSNGASGRGAAGRQQPDSNLFSRGDTAVAEAPAPAAPVDATRETGPADAGVDVLA